MKQFFLILIFFFSSLLSFSQKLNDEETKLYDLLMSYRKEKGLKTIPVSKSLNFVAAAHTKDLSANQPDKGNCNLHSWSAKGKWEACCYTDDHAKANCMWKKPSELTSYKHKGYEISHWSSDNATAKGALASWKSSSGHNEVIINSGIWGDEWKAIGISIYGRYAVVWFGNDIDN